MLNQLCRKVFTMDVAIVPTLFFGSALFAYIVGPPLEQQRAINTPLRATPSQNEPYKHKIILDDKHFGLDQISNILCDNDICLADVIMTTIDRASFTLTHVTYKNESVKQYQQLVKIQDSVADHQRGLLNEIKRHNNAYRCQNSEIYDLVPRYISNEGRYIIYSQRGDHTGYQRRVGFTNGIFRD